MSTKQREQRGEWYLAPSDDEADDYSVPKAVARWLDQAAQEWNDTDKRGLAR